MWIYDYLSEQDNPYREEPFVEVVHMCYVDNLPQWNYPFHSHPDVFEISFILTGNGSLMLDDKHIPVSAGSISLVPPDTLHHFADGEPSGMTYFGLRFRPLREDSEMGRFFRDLGVAATNSYGELPFLRQTISLLFAQHQANGGVADRTFQTIALALLQLARDRFADQTKPLVTDEHALASEIMNYISQEKGRGITLESLAKHFHISPSHLSRLFCNAYHVSPINYAINARITYATEFLLKSEMPIVEIAELVGYDNPTHFTNMFYKRIGCTPSEFRERNTRLPQRE